jgi:hypothetical protein
MPIVDFKQSRQVQNLPLPYLSYGIVLGADEWGVGLLLWQLGLTTLGLGDLDDGL